MDLQDESVYENPDYENLHASGDIELSQKYVPICYGVTKSKQKVDECAVSCSAAKKVSDDEVKCPPKKRLMCCSLTVIVMVITVVTVLTCLSVIFISISELNTKFSSLQQTEVAQLQQYVSMIAKYNETTTQIMQDISQLRSEIASLQENVSADYETTRQTLTLSFNQSLVAIWQVISQRSGFTTLRQCSDALVNFKTVLNPAASCAAVLELVPSGYYPIISFNGSAVCVYCDMTRSCGGVTGGWMRVAELDMTNSSSQCPSGLRQRNDFNIRTCDRDNSDAGCSSVIFTTGIAYSRICGRIQGYQYSSTNAFGHRGNFNHNINTPYVDGVSLTHGSPRQHIWTFAAAADEFGTDPSWDCPCTNVNVASNATLPPAFVGDDYFCDTGSEQRYESRFYNEDPLWDGAGCGPLSTCCSFNNPPWFYKQLLAPTTDDIEIRLCRDQEHDNEDVAIESYEIYVQ